MIVDDHVISIPPSKVAFRQLTQALDITGAPVVETLGVVYDCDTHEAYNKVPAVKGGYIVVKGAPGPTSLAYKTGEYACSLRNIIDT